MKYSVMRVLSGILAVAFFIVGLALLTVLSGNWLTSLNGMIFIGLSLIFIRFSIKGQQK